MDYLKAFLITEEKREWWKCSRIETCRWLDEQENLAVSWNYIPRQLLGQPGKLFRKIERKRKDERKYQLWLEPELRSLFPQTSVCEEWFCRIWKEQTKCSYLTLILPDRGADNEIEELEAEILFAECFLRDEFEVTGLGYLNGLTLLSPVAAAEKEMLRERSFFSNLYEETGLPACCAADHTETEMLTWVQMAERGEYRKKAGIMVGASMCIDFRKGYEIPYRLLPKNCFYLDMTSDTEKERLLYAKRKDIYYIGAMKFLDTYVIKRYNMYRCQ